MTTLIRQARNSDEPFEYIKVRGPVVVPLVQFIPQINDQVRARTDRQPCNEDTAKSEETSHLHTETDVIDNLGTRWVTLSGGVRRIDYFDPR